jgi:hypothetical protein
MLDVTAKLPLETEAASKSCEQCGQSFEPRSGSGGKAQRFCGTKCRAAFHSDGQLSQRSPTYSAPQTLSAVIPPAKKDEPAATPDDSKDFDWSNDDSIVLREQPETAIYFNPNGALVIRQRAVWPNDEDGDPYVYINPENIEHFLDKLTDICGVPCVGRKGDQ